MTSPFGPQQDLFFMQQALEQARCAMDANEVPIGAVVVNGNGEIVARSHNAVELEHTQVAHAELRAMEIASRANRDWRLNDHWVYVTLEPCLMCMGLMRLSRVSGLVFAAGSPVYGFRLDKDVAYQVYKDDAIKIIQGVGQQESVALLQEFFQKKRKERE